MKTSARPANVVPIAAGLLAIMTCAGAQRTLAGPARYEIDPAHLTIAFLVDHIGYAKTLGLFREASGSYLFDEATGEVSDLRVSVDTASVWTDHEERDEHLRGDDFLDVEAHPQMVFTAASARPVEGGDRYRIDGTLELLGRTAPVTLEAVLNKRAEYPIGGGLFRGKPFVMGVSARGAFERSDFGMRYGIDNGLVGNRVELILEFEARRQD